MQQKGTGLIIPVAFPHSVSPFLATLIKGKGHTHGNTAEAATAAAGIVPLAVRRAGNDDEVSVLLQDSPLSII